MDKILILIPSILNSKNKRKLIHSETSFSDYICIRFLATEISYRPITDNLKRSRDEVEPMNVRRG